MSQEQGYTPEQRRQDEDKVKEMAAEVVRKIAASLGITVEEYEDLIPHCDREHIVI